MKMQKVNPRVAACMILAQSSQSAAGNVVREEDFALKNLFPKFSHHSFKTGNESPGIPFSNGVIAACRTQVV